MRHRSPVPKILAAGVVAAAVVAGVATWPASATPHQQNHAAAAVHQSTPNGSTSSDTSERSVVAKASLPLSDRGPHAAAAVPKAVHANTARQTAAPTQSCTPADFASRTGDTLATYVKGSTTDCVNTLFSVTGTNAAAIFAESNMVAIANAFHTGAATYPGDNSTSVQQLVLFLRAGYYVQYNNSSVVPAYSQTLATAVEGGLDTYVAGPHFLDVSDNNGAVLAETMTLIDSADEQARYLGTVKQVLNSYNSSYDPYINMLTAVNNAYTPLFRGHQFQTFVDAVTADPSIIDTLNAFAVNHLNLLGTDKSYLDSNAGRELARFVQHAALQAKVRPLMKRLLGASSITGPTAPLWIGVAEMADTYDQSQCTYYDVCNLAAKLTAAALPISHDCDPTHTVLAQSLTAADLAAVCASILHQDAYFHSLVKDNGPIPGEYFSKFVLTVFASRADYQDYAEAIYGIDTNNGGMTLTGNPADPNNIARSIMYIKSADDGFAAGVWNLNHEYTHALDGQYDMKGDFSAEIVVPDIWWIEGLAEYVSYSYRGVVDTEAVTEAAKHTYSLSTLWQSTYDNSDVTRTYPWGYLAVRYMFEKHPADIYAMLAKFRVGDYQGGYAVYSSGIGTKYDADFNVWLDVCAAGACSVSGPPPAPTCPDPDPRALGKNCSRSGQSASAGGVDYFYIYVPAGTTKLTVTATGGTGTAYLYYNRRTWATNKAYTAKSTSSGTAQSITVTNPAAGYRYFSLYGQTAFGGVTVTATY